MATTYETLAQFAQWGGTVYCFVLFLGVLVYALWPANAKRFDEAARLPLRED
jgi:cytochrome c oxidase cbb3-type subunit IV